LNQGGADPSCVAAEVVEDDSEEDESDDHDSEEDEDEENEAILDLVTPRGPVDFAQGAVWESMDDEYESQEDDSEDSEGMDDTGDSHEYGETPKASESIQGHHQLGELCTPGTYECYVDESTGHHGWSVCGLDGTRVVNLAPSQSPLLIF
jgi:hypothetical protein